MKGYDKVKGYGKLKGYKNTKEYETIKKIENIREEKNIMNVIHDSSSLSNTGENLKHRCSKGHRHWDDKLVLTSGIYVFFGILSIGAGQWICGTLQICAGLASTAYHKSKETRFLHLDALVSSTLGFIGLWVVTHAYTSWKFFLIPAAFQMVMCSFSWIYCGLPGNPRYDDWHTYWHYASGISTAGTSAYLLMHIPHFDVLLMDYASSIFNVALYW